MSLVMPQEMRTGPLPVGWIDVALTDICQIVGGGTPSTKVAEYWEGDIPWISSADIYGLTDIRPRRKITEAAIRGSATNMVAAGAIVVVTRVGLGKVAIAHRDLCFSQDSQGLVFDADQIGGLYLTYFLSQAVQNFRYEGRGTTISGVTKKHLGEIQVLIPPLPEQRRIVAEIEKQFTRLDASVAALRRTQANLKRYRASVLRAACSGELVPTEAELARAEDREYEPSDVLVERILAERRSRWEAQEKRRGKYREPAAPDTSDLPPLPEGWVNSTMGQCFEVYVGATPRRNREDYWGGEIAWVSSSEVAFNRITATRETITAAGYDNASVNLHPKGTVLLGMIGEGKTRGQVAILDIPACNSQNSAALRVSEVSLPPEFVFYYLMGQYEATRRIGSGNNQPALNKSRVQEIVLPLPPLAEQHRIVAEVERRLSVIQQAETAVEASLRRAERLRQSILKRAFCGELVPRDPDDEPASVLLERIRAQREFEQAAVRATKKRPSRRRRSKLAAPPQLALEEASA